MEMQILTSNNYHSEMHGQTKIGNQFLEATLQITSKIKISRVKSLPLAKINIKAMYGMNLTERLV